MPRLTAAGAVEMIASGERGKKRRSEQRYPLYEPAVLCTSTRLYAATILDISKSGLSLSSSQRFERGDTVAVQRDDGTVLNCQVRYCVASEAEAFHIGLRITTTASERRMEARHPVNEAALLNVAGDDNLTGLPIMVRDISKSGIGINIATNLPQAAIVEIVLGASLITGTVQYGRLLKDGTYLAGCRIIDIRTL